MLMSLPAKPTSTIKLPAIKIVKRIVSGGQTGVDRTALEVAMAFQIEHGGWCPRGRLAEDGPIPAHFLLQETDSPRYHIRTEWNVRDSDATLILFRNAMSGGTDLTRKFAAQHRKQLLCVDLALGELSEQVVTIRSWLQQHQPAVLNVAGPRASSAPGISLQCREVLASLFRN
ncbi:Putative molybdenum carrier [Anatilimnocola aggregata]|uniref:Molybdenum carrier n=1 Tax=Anatilimnocola aggregata TaxID=2528021 RepID=A0A517YDP8_9BACT|nr:putative molybdenum carrier protein [Anatilimnocola aggregata]QDU28319.1 Putative molybdenum carrier [Anatilimnocola aggregata]